MPEPRFGHGDFQDPADLPDTVRRLHRKIMAHVRADRRARVPNQQADETGRVWPGLANPPQRKRSSR